MILVVLVVCLAIFALAAVVIVAMSAGPSKLVKQRLQALHWESAPTQFEETTDIRREEPAGKIVWLNRWLVKVNLASRSRLLLYQADVKTPPERLLLISLTGWVVAAGVIYLRVGALLPAIFLGAGIIQIGRAHV